MFRRDVFSERPPGGDYILSPTGFSWGIGRSNVDGSLVQMFSGERERSVALATLVMLADGNGADAWEALGADSYRLVKRCRSAT